MEAIPVIPFSLYISLTILVEEATLPLGEFCPEVCFLVTRLLIGVVKNLENTPANAPTSNSSTTPKVFSPLNKALRSRLSRRY